MIYSITIVFSKNIPIKMGSTLRNITLQLRIIQLLGFIRFVCSCSSCYARRSLWSVLASSDLCMLLKYKIVSVNNFQRLFIFDEISSTFVINIVQLQLVTSDWAWFFIKWMLMIWRIQENKSYFSYFLKIYLQILHDESSLSLEYRIKL